MASIGEGAAMKPQSIRRFDLFYLASIALSAVAYVMSYDALVASMEARTAAAGFRLGSGTVLATIVIGIGIGLVLWFLVSRMRSVVAKWFVVALFVLSLLGLPGLLSGGWTVLKTISALKLLLEAVAVYYLFQPDAKAWLGSRDAVAVNAPDEPDAID
jgi:hypothetical protein